MTYDVSLNITQIAPTTLARLVQMREAWQFIGNACTKGNPYCARCPFLQAPDCTLGWSGRHRPEHCPAYAAHMQALEEDDHEPLPCPECEGTGLTGGTPCLICDGRAFLHPVTGEPWKDETQ
jgi:hypothetical protein